MQMPVSSCIVIRCQTEEICATYRATTAWGNGNADGGAILRRIATRQRGNGYCGLRPFEPAALRPARSCTRQHWRRV